MIMKLDTIVKPLPTDFLINKYEGFWKLKLPEGFISFIKSYNGVVVEGAEFKGSNRKYMIERFLCMVDDIENNPMGIYDIDVVFSQIGERLTENEDLLGAEVLPIANVFAGDFICLDFRESKYEPTVCVWDHEESEVFEPVTYKISDSFSDFLDMLHE